MKKLLLILLLFAKAIIAEGIDSRLLLEFADRLYLDGEYYRAITEYRRFSSYYPDSIYSDKANINIAKCYYYGNEHLESVEWCRKIRSRIKNNDAICELNIVMAKSFLQLENYKEVRNVLIHVGDSCHNTFSDDSYYLTALSYIGDEDWEAASHEFMKVGNNSPLFAKAQQYSRNVLCGSKLSKKSVTTATCLSIIPGLGYIYTNNIQTGVASFLVNAVFGWGTYNAFKKKENGVGVVIGLFSFGWYTGNIYGGLASAHRYNERVKRNFKAEFK